MTIPRALLLAIAMLAIAPASQATQVVQMGTRELVSSSSDIVVGSVQETRSYWNPQHTRIFTDAVVRVGESLKGAGQPTLTVTQMGGVVDGMRLTIAGSPVFRPGDEAVLFLWRDPLGRLLVSGLAQGKFDIERDPVTGEDLVSRSLSGLSMHDARTRELVQQSAAPGRTRLDDLRREIRQAIEEGGR